MSDHLSSSGLVLRVEQSATTTLSDNLHLCGALLPSSKLTVSDFRDGATCPGEFGGVDHGNKTGDLNSMAQNVPRPFRSRQQRATAISLTQ